jgi:hypothetical protein
VEVLRQRQLIVDWYPVVAELNILSFLWKVSVAEGTIHGDTLQVLFTPVLGIFVEDLAQDTEGCFSCGAFVHLALRFQGFDADVLGDSNDPLTYLRSLETVGLRF